LASTEVASIVNASNLAVEYGAFNMKMFGDPSSKIRKATEDISIPGNQLPLAGFDVSESAKTILARNVTFAENSFVIIRTTETTISFLSAGFTVGLKIAVSI
jgi:hypothetical protein